MSCLNIKFKTIFYLQRLIFDNLILNYFFINKNINNYGSKLKVNSIYEYPQYKNKIKLINENDRYSNLSYRFRRNRDLNCLERKLKQQCNIFLIIMT